MNNEKQQDNDKATRNKTPQQQKSFWGKRWTFPVIYLAASVLIVGLMYAKSQDAAPYEIEKQNTGEQAGPVLPSDDATPANTAPSFNWPVGDGGEDAVLSLDFFKEMSKDEEKAMAVVSYESTFTPHEGVDIGLKSDAPFNVIAAAMGTVKAVKEDPLMGYTVEIDHGNGYTTYYASLSKVEVQVGSKVISGQPIAKSGNNRFEKEEKNHLHFELRKDGVAIDPNGVLPKKTTAYEASLKNGAKAANSDAIAPSTGTPSTGTPSEKTEEPKDAAKTDAEKKPGEASKEPGEKSNSPTPAN
ncbi:M23 family metallopeptidase [Tumebacillus algifaecis]|nr:M23 family metallopeptidase [Tumebacillus algifaecis]